MPQPDVAVSRNYGLDLIVADPRLRALIPQE
jgi:hypothetical protein